MVKAEVLVLSVQMKIKKKIENSLRTKVGIINDSFFG